MKMENLHGFLMNQEFWKPRFVTVLAGLLAFCIRDGFAKECIGCCITSSYVYLEVDTRKHEKIRKGVCILRHPLTYETSLKPFVQ